MEQKKDDIGPKKEMALKIALVGGGIGILSGLIQLISGSKISAITGHEENTMVLGLLTIILAGFASYCAYRSSRETLLDVDRRIAWFLGSIIPVVICFLTFGFLWIIPASLFLVSTGILIREMVREFESSDKGIIASIPHWKRTLALTGVLLIAIPLVFGGFTENTELSSFKDDEGSYFIRPMGTVEDEGSDPGSSFVPGVLVVHLTLLIGCIVALISGQLGAKNITIAAGVVVLIVLLFFFFFIPNILFIEGAKITQFDKDHFSSISGGLYVASFGAVLLIVSQMINTKKDDSSVNGK